MRPNSPKEQIELELRIEADEFNSRAELNAAVKEMGLFQARSGSNYVGVMTPAGVWFRLRVKGCLEEMKPIVPSFVYIIAAITEDGKKAAYVGSTIDLDSRLRKHAISTSPGHTSYELKSWARANCAEVRVSKVMDASDQKTGCLIEGIITFELEKAKWLLPGVGRWCAARKTAAAARREFGAALVWTAPTLADISRWPLL